MTRRSRFSAGRLDVSARAGVSLAAHVSGTSFQPNLLSRDSRDRALISGFAASADGEVAGEAGGDQHRSRRSGGDGR